MGVVVGSVGRRSLSKGFGRRGRTIPSSGPARSVPGVNGRQRPQAPGRPWHNDGVPLVQPALLGEVAASGLAALQLGGWVLGSRGIWRFVAERPGDGWHAHGSYVAGPGDLKDAQLVELRVCKPRNDATVAPAMRQWGKLVGEQQGALPTPEFRRFIDLRIRANTIGTTQTPCNVANYVQLLEDAFAPASVRVAFQPNGASLVRVTVTSGAALLAEPIAERATTVARRARPIGTLVSLHEVTETGVVYGVPGRGYSPTAWIGRSLSTGLGA
ncbi:MAG: hypothetical protein AAGA48_34630 [Myxococcota bacterium]